MSTHTKTMTSRQVHHTSKTVWKASVARVSVFLNPRFSLKFTPSNPKAYSPGQSLIRSGAFPTLLKYTARNIANDMTIRRVIALVSGNIEAVSGWLLKTGQEPTNGLSGEGKPLTKRSPPKRRESRSQG